MYKKTVKTEVIWELRKKPFIGHIKNNEKKKK
jgi:hypothetical protein